MNASPTMLSPAVLSAAGRSHDSLRAAIVDALKQDAVVLVRGLPALDDFVSLTEPMCRFQAHAASNFSLGIFGSRHGMSDDGTVTTVNLGAEEIPLHRERAYTPMPPQLMFFYCSRPPETPAPTTALDGAAFLDVLPERLRAFAVSSQMRYRCRFELTPSLKQLICAGMGVESLAQVRQLLPLVAAQLLKEDTLSIHEFSDERLVYDIVSPMVRRGGLHGRPSFSSSLIPVPFITMADGTPLEEVAEWQEICALARRHQYAHHWQPGDMLVVDNTAAMHGRLAHNDTARQIALRMGWLA